MVEGAERLHIIDIEILMLYHKFCV